MPSLLVTLGRLKPDGQSHLERYADGVIPLIHRFGGEIVVRMITEKSVVGDDTQRPDLVAVMRFPSPAVIRDFLGSDDYQRHVPHRERAFDTL
ncbi:MAG: DUF1330 domain-containing protein, partial [Planctomycetota bacterium]